jgi:two-component system, cell cycle response regulator
MSEIASPIRASERHIIARYALGGVLFGVCFPLAAWTLDTFLHHLPYNWSSLAHLHHINPIHYLVDSAPLILGVTFTAIGVKQAYIEQDRTALERTVAELSDANARLESLATTDGLTVLVNHRALQERLHDEYDRALRYNTPFSLLMLDVDNFKHYNDTYGHPAGDVVLRQVAQVLQETARTCDVVARYGGEEFVVLLPGADVEEAKTVAERFRNAVETGAWPERGITVSIGAATRVPTTLHPDTLLADADTALYRSKHRGRNCVTHANDAGEVAGLDTEAAGWADALFQKLLAIQKDQAGEVSEQVRESLLHAYDATIISKPGPLTDEEWVIMRQHTTVAYEMLQPIEFLGPALDIPYCHHEKWDGSGYPRGLQGEEIPLTARLFAVVDVYDALTSDRPYRKAWSEEKVRAYLREQSGTHFDPQAVDAFLNMLQEDCATPQAA